MFMPGTGSYSADIFLGLLLGTLVLVEFRCQMDVVPELGLIWITQ